MLDKYGINRYLKGQTVGEMLLVDLEMGFECGRPRESPTDLQWPSSFSLSLLLRTSFLYACLEGLVVDLSLSLPSTQFSAKIFGWQLNRLMCPPTQIERYRKQH